METRVHHTTIVVEKEYIPHIKLAILRIEGKGKRREGGGKERGGREKGEGVGKEINLLGYIVVCYKPWSSHLC